MKNPFEKLFGGGQAEQPQEAQEETIPGESSVEAAPESNKEKKLAELRTWREQVVAGMGMDPVPQDQEQLDSIDKQIAEVEAQQ